MLIDNAHLQGNELHDKVVIVTGAGQGIGKEAARILAHLGASVVIAEINDTGRETEQLIRAAGGQALFVKTDVADPQSMERLRDQAQAAFGKVDVLVNNAETTEMKLTLEHTIEEWDRVLAVNLRGAFLGIKYFLPEMLQRRDGVIITFESSEGMPFMSAYFVSKVGLRSLAMSLAQEVGESGVAVFCFGAGMVDTPTVAIAAQKLGQFYHITPEDFIKQSAPGGQLISAELCATGLVGTILHAKEFHGQGDVGYILGLSALGLDPQGEEWKTDSSAIPIEPPASVETPVLVVDSRQQAIELNRQVEAVVQGNLKEYDDLSMFQRPIVKRMFQQGTGLKVEEWISIAADMTRRLESPAPIEPATLNAYLAQLKRMADFITKQESDARGWIKDPQQLQIALRALADRKATMLNLIAVLTVWREQS